MKVFEQCPVCGGELMAKRVEKLLRGGRHTATVMVDAQVCMHCGERLYAESDIRHFESIRDQLAHNHTQDFILLGESYKVALA